MTNVDALLHAPPLSPPPRRGITLRSIGVGTVCIGLVCGLTNYNDHVVVNTFLIGSYLPLAVVLLLFIIVILFNGLLHRLLARHALSSQELSIILLMSLIGCSFPAQGLFRYFIPLLSAPFREGSTNPRFWQAFINADLPQWLFPVSFETGRNNPVINDFYGRVQPNQAIPYYAWIKPLLGWGVFILGWIACLLSLAWIFRRQWAVNERLPFPIASMEAALIAEPAPGRMLNTLLGARLFWMGVAVVFFWQSSGALAAYFPKNVPALPLRYNLGSIMANEPWNYFAGSVKSATIYFTFIGIAYFIQSRIAFSLWASFLLYQLVQVQQRMVQNEIPELAWRDQHFGASIAFTLGFLWIARHHLGAICRQFIGRPGATALTATENYRPAVIIFLVGLGVMVTWLLLLGVQWWFAMLLVAMVLLSHLVTARVVAETGLPFVRYDVNMTQLFGNMPPRWLTTRDLFFSAGMYVFGPISTRESVGVFGQSGMVTAEQSGMNTAGNAGKMALVMVWAVLFALVVSSAASLWTHYTYATPIPAKVQHAMIDPPAMDRPRTELVDPIVRHTEGSFAPQKHSQLAHFTTGFTVTGVLQFLSLRSAAWPLLPVGYLLCSRWYIGTAWFSLMIGWLAKVIILKYGGASMYQNARPLFIGIIFGEALAAGGWLLISLALSWAGYDYQSVPMLPN